MSSTRKKLTPEDARRALYIDFEGRKDQVPVLLGCTRKSRNGEKQLIWQAVTDLRFASLATIDGLEAMTFSAAVERILQRAEKKDRKIVAWSEHELDLVREYCPTKLDRFEARYVNAMALALRWRNKCHDGQKPAFNTLGSYLSAIDYAVPETAGPGQVGTTLRILGDAFDRGRTASDLTDVQRRRWDALREHNRHDCVGMRRVTLLAAREIAGYKSPKHPKAA